MAHKLIFSIKVVLYATLFIIIDKNKMNVIQTHKNTCPLENACLYPIFAPVTEELPGLY